MYNVPNARVLHFCIYISSACITRESAIEMKSLSLSLRSLKVRCESSCLSTLFFDN